MKDCSDDVGYSYWGPEEYPKSNECREICYWVSWSPNQLERLPALKGHKAYLTRESVMSTRMRSAYQLRFQCPVVLP
jgi:hypothetical protein